MSRWYQSTSYRSLDRGLVFEKNIDMDTEPAMNSISMTNKQQSAAPATWHVGRGQALRLPAVGRARWLRVVDGEVWLTASGTPDDPAGDCWLRRDGLALLPAHRAVVLEGHPRASFQLLEPATAQLSGASPGASGWPRWLQRLLPARAASYDAPCSAAS
jgi:hypothetical protein